MASVTQRSSPAAPNNQYHQLHQSEADDIPLQPYEPYTPHHQDDYHLEEDNHEHKPESFASHIGEHVDSYEARLVSQNVSTYGFKRYTRRAALNTFGPLLLLAMYLYIVCEYMLRPSGNDVIPSRLIPARGVFYTWVILSIFVLDWAKSGLAGFEAAALMKPRLAPSNGIQLLWHADRAWGSLSGWYKAVLVSFKYIRSRVTPNGSNTQWDGPGLLWVYLAVSSLLFYVAIPLSGISMDIQAAFKLSDTLVNILGTNSTTFSLISNVAIQTTAANVWRVGGASTPVAPTIFYAPANSENVSSTYYDDMIQRIYDADIGNSTEKVNRSVTFFSPPSAAARAHGRAWGLETTVSCAAVHPQKDLKIITNVVNPSSWNTTWLGSSSRNYLQDSSNGLSGYDTLGLSPVLFLNGTTYGVDWSYVIASDRDISAAGNSDYVNASALPIDGAFELVMWQSIDAQFPSSEIFNDMSSNPVVMTLEFNNKTMHAYGIRCTATSDTGYAQLDAARATYNDFERASANITVSQFSQTSSTIWEWPGPFAIQSIVFGSLSQLAMAYLGPPACTPGSIDVTCDLYWGANVATGGTVQSVQIVPDAARTSYPGSMTIPWLTMPIISAERMTLAMYKLFGHTAAAMMQLSVGTWQGELRGVEETIDLIPGKVPWQMVLALLIIWTFITVIPQAFVFFERRWSSTLEAFELLRIGAAYPDLVKRFTSNDFSKNQSLREMPGLVGDMNAAGRYGFVGLSRDVARSEKRYVNSRDDAI